MLLPDNFLGSGSQKFARKITFHNQAFALIATDPHHFYPPLSDMSYRGIQNLIYLQNFPQVTPIVGFCITRRKILVLQPVGVSLLEYIGSPTYSRVTITQRIRLVKSFLSVFEFLHKSPIGSLVNCDFHNKNKTLSQFLVIDGRVVINDLDRAYSVSDGYKINCKLQDLSGIDKKFVSPEELLSLNDESISSVNQKADIFKIPTLIETILYTNLANPKGLNIIMPELHSMGSEFLNPVPELRPDIDELVKVYSRMLSFFRE